MELEERVAALEKEVIPRNRREDPCSQSAPMLDEIWNCVRGLVTRMDSLTFKVDCRAQNSDQATARIDRCCDGLAGRVKDLEAQIHARHIVESSLNRRVTQLESHRETDVRADANQLWEWMKERGVPLAPYFGSLDRRKAPRRFRHQYNGPKRRFLKDRRGNVDAMGQDLK